MTRIQTLLQFAASGKTQRISCSGFEREPKCSSLVLPPSLANFQPRRFSKLTLDSLNFWNALAGFGKLRFGTLSQNDWNSTSVRHTYFTLLTLKICSTRTAVPRRRSSDIDFHAYRLLIEMGRPQSIRFRIGIDERVWRRVLYCTCGIADITATGATADRYVSKTSHLSESTRWTSRGV